MAAEGNQTVIVTNLPVVPKKFESDMEIWRFLNALRDRVGGASGSIIYDSANSAQTVSSLEPQLFAIQANLESQLTGIVMQIVEQIQEQQFDPTALTIDTANVPPEPPIPEDFGLGGFIQQAISSAPVQSVFGRTGDIVAVEGDYDLDELGDVTLTAPASNQVLSYNGTVWVNSGVPAGSISGNVPIANGGTGQNNATNAFTALAPSQAGNAGEFLTTNGTVASWSATPLVAPNYEEIVATAGQTVFNTTLTTTAKAAGKAYLQIFVNGIFQQEGATKEYTVTGATQITFNAGLALNDDVVIYSYA